MRCGSVCRLITINGGQLLENLRLPCFERLALIASASTIFSRIARSAGGMPTISASNTAAPRPGIRAVGDSSTPCKTLFRIGKAP